jgi:hypothetical protein
MLDSQIVDQNRHEECNIKQEYKLARLLPRLTFVVAFNGLKSSWNNLAHMRLRNETKTLYSQPSQIMAIVTRLYTLWAVRVRAAKSLYGSFNNA